jgi:hypothetical protein
MDPVESNMLYLPYGNDYDGFSVLKSTDGGGGGACQQE